MGVGFIYAFGRSYGIKNNTPVINKTTKKFDCNMISTIANKELIRFMIFKYRFNTDIFLNFLRKLIYRQKKKIFSYLTTTKYIIFKRLQIGLKNIKIK